MLLDGRIWVTPIRIVSSLLWLGFHFVQTYHNVRNVCAVFGPSRSLCVERFCVLQALGKPIIEGRAKGSVVRSGCACECFCELLPSAHSGGDWFSTVIIASTILVTGGKG